MATRTPRYARRTRSAKTSARQAARSKPVVLLGRAGFLARGLQYIVIGWIALQIAFGNNSQQADRTGALHELSSTPVGKVALWILVVGFFGMALWRLSEVAFGNRVDGQKAGQRLIALVKAVIYAVLGYGVLKYALGLGAPQSSNKQSQDLTASVMQHPGGKAAIIVIGLVLIGVGLFLAYEAWKMKFLKELDLSRTHARTRQIVEWLGRIGGIARGIVFVTAGIFLVVAAADAQPGQAKGIDASLRALASTPLGPVLLVLVAIGLIMFGLFSCCEARWRKF